MLGRSQGLLAALATGSLLVMSGGAASAQPGSPDELKVIIRYETRPGPRERLRLRSDNDAEIRFTYRNIDAVAATIPRGQLRSLRAQPNVVRVEIDHPLMLFDHGPATGDPELEASWGVEHIGAARVHQTGNEGSPIRVAVIDTGIDCGHPDLDANCVGGVSYIPGTTSFDDYGHGTHVAGIVAAERNGIGVVGVGPQVELFAMKVLDSSGQGDYSGLIAALDQVATWNADAIPDNDIDVVNMSLGGHDVSGALQLAVEAAHASGAILVAATGNVNPFDWMELFYGCPVAYPGAYPEVLSTTFTDGNDALTGYSCTGPEVDFAAPGDYVTSTVPASGPLSSPSGYTAASGTSMASPHLAGTVALLLSHGIDDTNGNGRQDEIKAHLCANTKLGYGVLSTPIPPSDPRYPLYFGCGVVDAGAALVDDPPGGGPPTDDPPSVDAGPNVNGTEGAAVAILGSVIDDGTPTSSWSASPGPGVDAGASCTFGDPSASSTSVTCTDDGTWTLTLEADDGTNPPVSDSATLTLGNAQPVVEAGTDQTIGVGDPASLDPATFTDAGANDSHTAIIHWGDSTDEAGVVTEGAGSGSVDASHTYAAPGVYIVTVTVSDDDHVGGSVDGEASDTLTITVVDVPPPAIETLTFTSVADAWVNSARANRNYGSAGRLQVRNGQRRSFLRFDVSGIDGSVMSATLRLYVADAGNAGLARVVTDGWLEGSVTWNDQPAMGTSLDSPGFTSSGTWVEFDVTDAVAGNGSHSFAIAGGSSNLVKYHSREASRDPQLVVDFVPGPAGAGVSEAAEPSAEPTLEPTVVVSPSPTPSDLAEEPLEPSPEPEATPQPEATPESSAHPLPAPASTPTDQPTPESVPTPTPQPTLGPRPEQPGPTAEPMPDATPEAKPEPKPTAEPKPDATPEPEPKPTAEPKPTPEPKPDSTPESNRTPEPTPEPGLAPASAAEPSPDSHPAPSNQGPKADAGGPYKVDEGESIRLDGRGSSDPDGHIVAYDWSRKGRLDDPTKARPGFMALDDAELEIELTVTDDQGAKDTGRTRIVVRNVEPRLAEIEPRSIPAGEELRLDAIRFHDPGTDDTHEVTIDWGDGTTSSATISGAGMAQGNHAYADEGHYRVRVTVRDDDGGSASTSFSVDVTGGAPEA